jgi:predicted RNA-binding Zn-ribbon protein involved in translation (DUF1610 family)
MPGIATDDPGFALKCPSCGRSTQYNLARLNERLKDGNHVDFFCVACGYTEVLTTDKFPGLPEALENLENSE